jgi:putative ABC transport system permease protein
MPQVVALSVARQRLHRLLMTLFGGSALLLAAVGVFGLIAFAVQQRSQEIGLRMALGAAPSRVARMVCREGMRVIALGLVGGLIAAYFLANGLQSMLFGIDAHDLVIFFSIPTLLMLVALSALAIPALRASRLNPVDALRAD